jgi:hypothetical protein
MGFEALTTPMSSATTEDQTREKGLRFQGTVRKVALHKEDPDSISFDIQLDMEFKNLGSQPIFLVNSAPAMKGGEYVISGAFLAESPDAAQKNEYLLHDSGAWQSVSRGPEYHAFRECLDAPSPSSPCLWRLAPQESHALAAKIILTIEKKKMNRTGKLWSEFDLSKPLWMKTCIEAWPFNLEYQYQTTMQPTGWHGVFRNLLQRRWRKEGMLAPPARMLSEPMRIDLSPWQSTKP